MEEVEENGELPTLEYYKNNKDWPIYFKEQQLNIVTIFKICLQCDVPEEGRQRKDSSHFCCESKTSGVKAPF